jgi:hypothetical protein
MFTYTLELSECGMRVFCISYQVKRKRVRNMKWKGATELPIIGLPYHTPGKKESSYILHAIIEAFYHTHIWQEKQESFREKKGQYKFIFFFCFITRNGKFISASHTLPLFIIFKALRKRNTKNEEEIWGKVS